ncbi:MAG: hypothetical protein NTX29_01060 [Actinobacteria bacterium]|nr:hypothetical protein [Actinomycetota bacterium]
MKKRADDDSGVAMILVMAWGLLMMGIVLAVSQMVVNQVVPSDRSEHSYSALAAAEAGLADLQARIAVGTIASVQADTTNLALKGWVPVPGGNTNSEFTYAIDGTKSGAVGEVRAYATGRSGDVTRTVEAVLSKRSTLDYVYMSDIETPSPDTPGVYPSTLYGTSGKTYQEIAATLCSRRWSESGPVTVSTTGAIVNGTQRNLRFCKWAGIFASERLIGAVHTNDVWWLENTSLASTLQVNGITSSCRKVTGSSDPGCPDNHRFIASSAVSAGTPSQYQGDSWSISGTDSTQRNPLYDSVLDLPPSPDLLKQRAAETGCIFTGPTRIRFSEEGGIGYMYVTSPDTKKTRAGCDGADGTTLQSAATSQVTKKVALTDFSDLVIYVQNVHPSTEVDNPSLNYTDPLQKYYWEKQNRWTSGTEPTCTLKSGKKYPFVIPNDATDKAYFNAGSTYKGFPSELADVNSPWYGTGCANGDLYVQGAYKGAIMLATDNNVVLTSSLRDSSLFNAAATTASADYGRPSTTSLSVLGIAAAKFSYAYRPVTSASAWVGDWKSTNATNPIYNFALLAIQKCWGSQGYDLSTSNGNIYLWGSIAQKYRCAVGISGTSGYGKMYKYDDRLKLRTPPYMLELSDEPWGKERMGEMTVEREGLSTPTTWQLLRPDDVGATVKNVKLASAPDATKVTMTPSGSQVTLTTTQPGLIVVTYEVTTADTRDVRRLVVLAE